MYTQNTLVIFSPSIEDGGVEKNLFAITNYFSSKINKTVVISANSNKKKNFIKKVIYLAPPTSFFNNSNRILKTIVSLLMLIYFFFKENNKITILSFNSNLYAIIIAKILNSKIIIRSNTAPSSYAKNLPKKILFGLILKFANGIIVNSLEFKKELKKFFGIKSLCIYNSLGNYKNIIYLSKKNSYDYFKSRNLRLLSVGRLVKQKDHLTFLKALNKIKHKINFKALIVGNGEEKKVLENFIQKNNLNNCVSILNYKNNIYPIIKQCDVFILSSKYEGLPNVLIEALALNKIIISSNCKTGPREILNNGEYGTLFIPGDFNKLSSLIIDINNNKNFYKKKANLGLKSISRFNDKKIFEKYHKFILTYLK